MKQIQFIFLILVLFISIRGFSQTDIEKINIIFYDSIEEHDRIYNMLKTKEDLINNKSSLDS